MPKPKLVVVAAAAVALARPAAVAVLDPCHVVRRAGDGLDRGRRRVQQAIHGHRGMKGDPLYSARRTLHTGADLLTDKQTTRLQTLFAVDEHGVPSIGQWRPLTGQRDQNSGRQPTPTPARTRCR